MADDFGSMWGLERRRGGTLSSSPLQGRWLVAGLLLVSGLIGVVNINAIPPDAHEVYVLVSAQQMRERGDWIVPYFQGEPRLAKPPLNYWLTAVAAELSGSEYVEPWHGRVPSVLGGVRIMWLRVLIGRMLVDGRSAMLAGLLACTTLGYITFTHSARPEMLYAGCCTLQLAGFAWSWSAFRVQRSTFSGGMLMWIGAGLATLTKGPHLPAMLMVGSAIFVVVGGGGWRGLRAVFRPVAGLICFTAIALPWWLMMHRALGEQLAESELVGESYDIRLSHLLSVYYPVQLLKLHLTWIVLLPVGVMMLLRRGRGSRGVQAARLAGWLTVAVMAGLWMGSHRRDYYLLPLSAPIALLLATGAIRATRMAGLRQLWNWIVPVYLVILLAVVGYALFATDYIGGRWVDWPEYTTLMITVLVGGVYLSRHSKANYRPSVQLAICAGLVVLMMLMIGWTAHFWSGQRFEKAAFAQSVVRLTGPGQMLVSLDIQPDLVIYYSRRIIPRCDGAEELRSFLLEHPGPTLVVSRLAKLEVVSSVAAVREVLRFNAKDENESMVLVEVMRPQVGFERLPN